LEVLAADSIQAAIRAEGLDGRLFYSFRGSDPIAENILRLDNGTLATRRWFYLVPASGSPRGYCARYRIRNVRQLARGEDGLSPLAAASSTSSRCAGDFTPHRDAVSPLNAIPYVPRRELASSHRPIVAVNAHSADPHYQPDRDRNLPMPEGDFLLLDIWAKQKLPHSVYDDIP
jgi:hypothetical protein